MVVLGHVELESLPFFFLVLLLFYPTRGVAGFLQIIQALAIVKTLNALNFILAKLAGK